MSRIPRIVILGAGYGGIVTALRLQKELNYNEADVTLVNKHDYHYITTHLHMPAAGTDHPENARVDISKLIDEFKIDFVKSTVIEIRPQDRKVILEDGTLSYDYLVVGLGGEPETFGIPGLKEYAMNIRSINSVRLIREHIEYQFAQFKRDSSRPELLTFVVGGAGFTGIEFVGELADRVPELCREFDVDPKLVKIYNIEAAPTAMPGFDPELVQYAISVLEKKGVIFKLATAIKECTPDGVVLATGEEIKSGTVVWTGGIRGNRLLEEAGFETMRGRIKVDKTLRSTQFDNVFVIGDCSLIFNEEGRPYPPTAQIAMQQGVTCAHNLTAAIRGEPMKEFKPQIKGTVASLGKGEAIGIVGKYKLKGATAAFMKKIIDMRYLYIIGGIPLVLRKGRL
ncbi:NAD(P)/FAD-dependent oxidoreductase [Paenibacillus thermoaerophilus]|uniref:NAD(P)/FAD-dependent oxidoreductase n=1 Tax=Paenibacillus thermoaerophilus TaxID=1215385 RepID=A0ABW2V124_9BACL|nr:NAD(P)/FAD-dependent oxidoreductase [Paenibacillus thermoaerophilus]TMV18387.1 NAD(P)/FAD-dependent oxidoreductase [Paenibacillus thermoaerophilus]